MVRRCCLVFFLIACSLLWSSPSTYLRALDAIARQQYEEANRLLRSALQDPALSREYRARVYNFLGDIALVNQSYRAAQTYYRQVLESYSDTRVYPRAIYNMARMFIIQGDHDAGIALLSDYINRYAVDDLNEDGALYWLGRAFAAKQEPYRALGLYRELLSRFPASTYAFHTRQLLQNLETTMRATRAQEIDIEAVAKDQARYLRTMARFLELQNQLLNLKRQKTDDLRSLLVQEGL